MRFLLADIIEPLCCLLKQVHQEFPRKVEGMVDMGWHHHTVMSLHLKCVG